jgi:hypothetical protein
MLNGKKTPIFTAVLLIAGITGAASPGGADSASIRGITVALGRNNEVLVNGKPFFPIMQWRQRTSSIAAQKELGINTFVGLGDESSTFDFCDEARKRGVYAVPPWDPDQVASVKNNPALLGWVFDDEPDNQDHHVPPAQIRMQYRDLKTRDPGHLSFLTITSGFSAEDKLPDWMNGSNSRYYEYPRYTDMIGFDYYPVYGWCRPDWIYKVGQEERELIATFAGAKKGIFQWIECSRTSSKWCHLPSRGADDGPFDYEVKDEVWLAIVNGANAIGYFTHSWQCPDYAQCCLNSALTAMLIKVNGQIGALTKVLCAADAKDAAGVQVADPHGRVTVRVKEYRGSRYLIAVSVLNVTGARDTQQVRFSVPGLTTRVRVYDEARYLSPNAGTFSDTFTRKDPVHIYVMPING